MIIELETLNALNKHKTMGRAATALRVTQSSVSKRIQALESMTHKILIKKNGRHVELTQEGQRLLDDGLPLLRELKDLIGQKDSVDIIRLDIGFSESILSSWGAKAIGAYSKVLRKRQSTQEKSVTIAPHAHRTPVIVDRVSSGDYNLAIIGGEPRLTPGIHTEKVGEEEMVIIGKRGDLFCVGIDSGTWKSIAENVKKKKIKIDERSEFLSPIAHLAKNGFCRGLVPISVALSAGFRRDQMTSTGLSRPIYAVGRKRAFLRDEVVEFLDFIRNEIPSSS